MPWNRIREPFSIMSNGERINPAIEKSMRSIAGFFTEEVKGKQPLRNWNVIQRKAILKCRYLMRQENAFTMASLLLFRYGK